VRFSWQNTFLLPCVCVLVSLGACGQSAKERREWRPEDHQPPPAVAPEGQGAGEGTGDPTVRAAAALWSMRCAPCHGEGGRGDGRNKPPGAPVPNFTSAAFHEARSDAQLGEVISKGRGLMPPFEADITDTGIAALIAHIRTLRGE